MEKKKLALLIASLIWVGWNIWAAIYGHFYLGALLVSLVGIAVLVMIYWLAGWAWAHLRK